MVTDRQAEACHRQNSRVTPRVLSVASMTAKETDMSTELGYDVFISEPISQNVTELLPNGDRAGWSPLSATLIHGRNDAVLADPPFTRDQAHTVGDWVQASNKNLTHIFATHGHGDHWFTAGMLAERFGAQIIATPGTIDQMHRNVAMREAVWDRLFPGQIPETTVAAVPPENNRIELEGYPLDVVEVGHTDTDAASVLHVPDLDLVVAGDAVYNGVHLYLAESADGGRDKWRSAIDIVEALNPRWIVAGHKNKDLDDTATRTMSETRDYLDSADELLSQQPTALGFFNAMVERYPDRLNPGALWLGATALCR
jgi:glyoxylase-like metal-dependent hydrolase (beta-lactamase superfamily II)